MTDCSVYYNHYKEVSNQLFIFYTSLIDAGFSNEQAFELVRTCTNNSAIEQMVNSIRRASENARLSEKLRKLNNREG